MPGSTLNGFGAAINQSTINFAGNGELASLLGYEQATLNMTGGTISGVGGFDSATVSVTGGQIIAAVNMIGSSTGTVGGVTIEESGGSFVDGKVELRNQSQLQLNNVVVGQDVKLFHTSKATLANTTIHGLVDGIDQTTLNSNGGSVAGSVTGYNLTMAGTPVGGDILVAGASSSLKYSGARFQATFNCGGLTQRDSFHQHHDG